MVHAVGLRPVQQRDVFEIGGHPLHDVEHVAREIALCIPEVDLEGEGVAARLGIDHPLQRRIGNEAAVPILLAFDLYRRKTGRQRAAGHDVLWPDGVGRVIETDEVAGSDVDRACAEARHPGVESIKIHQTLQRIPERLRIVEAGRPERPARLQPGHQRARREESCCAERGSKTGTHLVEQIARVVASRHIHERVVCPIPGSA